MIGWLRRNGASSGNVSSVSTLCSSCPGALMNKLRVGGSASIRFVERPAVIRRPSRMARCCAKMITPLLSLIAALAAASSGAQDRYQSFDVNIPQPPTPVLSEGHWIIAYELHLTNFTAAPLQLHELRVLTPDGRKIASWADRELIARVVLIGAGTQPQGKVGQPTEPGNADVSIGAGERAVLYIELQLPGGKMVRAVRHEIDYRLPDGALDTVVPDVLSFDTDSPAVLGPPLRGGPWVAVHDPSWPRGHRRTLYALGGKARLPGRFAVDWVGTDANGRVSRGDPDRPADAIGYNSDVLAGADSIVSAVRDGLPQSIISDRGARALTDEAGNFVALRLGPKRFAFYEHLRPGSIRVRVGDRVSKGQVIGSLGFSGQTTGPHLHLHVARCDQPLLCEGLPFEVADMAVVGRYDSIADLGKRPWTAAARRPALPEWPYYNVVVRFP
jgi:murein DD-endopeptidase